jgi:drug/metabolite transporter (DMT)-like permease
VAVLSAVLVVLLSGTWLLSGQLVTDTPVMAVAAGRTGFCCLTLLCVAATSSTGRAGMLAVARRTGTALLLGFLGFFCYTVGTLLAMPVIGTTRTNLVVTMLPCLSLALGVMFFGQKSGRIKVLGTTVAVGSACCYALVADGTTGTADSVTGGAGSLGLAFAATLGFALHGFLYRSRVADVPPLAALPVVLGAATVMLLPLTAGSLSQVTARQWTGLAVLGVVVYAPAYLVQHRLILLRGPLVTAAVQLAVPFLVRLGDWMLGPDGPPGALELALLAACCAGIWLVVSPPGG